MSFVGLVIKETAIVEMKKPYYKYSILELDKLITAYLFFEGNLKKDDKIVENYMVKPSLFTRIKISIRTIFKLLIRMFKKLDEV